jgi:DNA-binding beta-propeller fold protein YncE
MVLGQRQLFVADTENHLLRRIDLRSRTVTTLAGTGEQSRQSWPGLEGLGPNDPLPKRWVGPPSTTALNSPWALWIHDEDLFIAMAGPHQIWKMPLSETEIGPFAGNGREDIVDGRLLPPRPYQEGFSSFAQPSGLASDGKRLFVADSEGSSIRAVPFSPRGRVRTIVGTAKLPQARLFTFGDRDGSSKQVLLQHALGIVHHEGQLYITDTYNNKIKAIDASTGETKTIAGSGQPGSGDHPAEFDEPAGISFAKGTLYIADTNNHSIRTIDLGTGEVGTLKIAGLQPPGP